MGGEQTQVRKKDGDSHDNEYQDTYSDDGGSNFSFTSGYSQTTWSQLAVGDDL